MKKLLVLSFNRDFFFQHNQLIPMSLFFISHKIDLHRYNLHTFQAFREHFSIQFVILKWEQYRVEWGNRIKSILNVKNISFFHFLLFPLRFIHCRNIFPASLSLSFTHHFSHHTFKIHFIVIILVLFIFFHIFCSTHPSKWRSGEFSS